LVFDVGVGVGVFLTFLDDARSRTSCRLELAEEVFDEFSGDTVVEGGASPHDWLVEAAAGVEMMVGIRYAIFWKLEGKYIFGKS